MDLVLAGHAIDVGTGATNPASLHDGRPPPRLRHVPGQELAACATAKNQDFKSLRLRHAYLRVMLLCLAILGGHSIEVLSTSAPTPQEAEKVSPRTIDAHDVRQVQIEWSIIARRAGYTPGLLHLADPYPREIALELQANSVWLRLHGDPQHVPSPGPKRASRMPTPFWRVDWLVNTRA